MSSASVQVEGMEVGFTGRWLFSLGDDVPALLATDPEKEIKLGVQLNFYCLLPIVAN